MNDQIMDKLQWAFDLVYGMIPRTLTAHAVEPLLVGHRGVFEHPSVRENTLPAFDIAVAHGGGIEFDLHLTRDNVLVVHHDPTLARVHRAPQAVADLSLAQLQEIAPEVPTLDEVLQRYQRRCPHFFIEPKVSDSRGMEILLCELAHSLDRFRLNGHATLISPHTAMLDLARRRQPHLPKAIIFFMDPRPAVDYVYRYGDTGLAGWYFTYPEKIRLYLERRNLHCGIGHVDWTNTYVHYRNRGYQYQFSNRIDRLVRPATPLTIPTFPALAGAAG